MRRLRQSFTRAEWRPAAAVNRDFVRYRHPQPSPGQIWRDAPKHVAIRLSVVIPTTDADRSGSFPRLLEQVEAQTFHEFELLVLRGDPRQGRAINIGAALAQGEYLMTLDDDTSLPDPETFTKLVRFMEADPELGVAGGNNVVPKDAPSFVRRAMQQIPRRSWRPVETITDSDLAEHPCLIMRTAEFKAIGGENELLPRGLDPYLRQAFREAGKRVVVVPGVFYHHLLPDQWAGLFRQFYRNGQQAAYVNRHYPQWAIETPSIHGTFRSRLPLPIRLLRFPVRTLLALLTGKPIWFFSQVAYGLGFLCHWVKPSDGTDA